jgi:hypothetical protein
MMEAEHLQLVIRPLRDIRDKGNDIVVTTYANFYQNDALEDRDWDLIVYDECHYLNQNAKGDDTVYLEKHRRVANLPSAAKEKILDRYRQRPVPEEFPTYDEWRGSLEAWKFQIKSSSLMMADQTKVVFLSATPFAYHKSLFYADGCLFDINETLEERDYSGGYNVATGWNQFFAQTFGYRMRYNKLTIPEVGVDQDLLEREFFEKYRELGVMSTRVLKLNFDYSRHFVKVNNEFGDFIDRGISMWHDSDIKDKYKDLAEVISKKYNYLYVNQLLECIKVQEIIPRIREHLKLGRKVVVFHSYNHTVMTHPFHFEVEKLVTADTVWMSRFIQQDIDKWSADHPEFVNLDLSKLLNVREALGQAFPGAVEFNGTVSKKNRQKNRDDFNKPKSGVNLIIVQSKAGREGISLHDTQGTRQRVLINLALPVAPTEAIQSEGRIYRDGVKSDAIYEYATLHTNFEKIAFAEKIASRAKTAENLAMGNLARDLETSFKEGYIAADNHQPYLGQGIGGKEADRVMQGMSEFQKAKTYYFSRGKKTSQNKSFEGTDYFATPEPLGFKMVEWLNPQPEEGGLEPSSGHGAISRYFPKFCANVMVEPSMNLYAEMALVSSGRTENCQFEDFKIHNKFDFIAMNPPFGSGGKTAAEHIQKAVVNHFRSFRQSGSLGGRLLAIIPIGSSMDKRLEILLESKAFQKVNFTGEILLPEVTFKRAGTGTRCRIIRIEHINTDNADRFQRIDLTYCSDIGEFFDAIEHLNF